MDHPDEKFINRKEFVDWLAFHVKVERDLMMWILSLKGVLTALSVLSPQEMELFGPVMREKAESNPYVRTLQGILSEIAQNRNPTPKWTDFEGTVQ